MKSGMTRWKVDPLYPKPFSPVHSARKFSKCLCVCVLQRFKLIAVCCVLIKKKNGKTDSNAPTKTTITCCLRNYICKQLQKKKDTNFHRKFIFIRFFYAHLHNYPPDGGTTSCKIKIDGWVRHPAAQRPYSNQRRRQQLAVRQQQPTPRNHAVERKGAVA